MAKQIIQPSLAPRPIGDYSHAWVVSGGKLIFTAGQVSADNDGNVVGVGDIVKQTTTALENLKLVLDGAGAGMQDVIKLNIYVTNIAEFRQKTREVRRQYFPNNFPGSTLVEVRSLARPDFMVEIEAVAAIG